MRKCLSEDDSSCYKSARDLMNELVSVLVPALFGFNSMPLLLIFHVLKSLQLPLVGMEFRARIPLSVKEEVGENAVASVKVKRQLFRCVAPFRSKLLPMIPAID